MSIEECPNELLKKYGLPGATAVLVIQSIQNEKLSELDLVTITELWDKKYKELSKKKSSLKAGCVILAFAGLIFHGHVKFRDKITIKGEFPFSKNYDYVKTAISILESDYDNEWPSTLKIRELWTQVFATLNRRQSANNSQLHMLKALIDSGLIRSFSGLSK